MKKLNSNKVIAIDFGTKRVGLAIADPTLSFALPFCVLKNDEYLFTNLKKIIEDENITLIILGYPKTFNNYISQRHQLILDFQKKLSNFLKDLVEIILFDESYSTKSAHSLMIDSGANKKHYQNSKDMVSACVFLENYLAKVKIKNGK